MARSVVGIFRSESQAEKAVRELKQKGFEKDVSVIHRDRREGARGEGGGGRRDMEVADQDLGEGTAWGGGLGAVAGLLAGAGALAIPGIGPIIAAGPIAATLTGAVAGSIAGGLVDWGIPEEEGRRLEEEIRRGGVVTLVKAPDDKASEVSTILRQHGAVDVKMHRFEGERRS